MIVNFCFVTATFDQQDLLKFFFQLQVTKRTIYTWVRVSCFTVFSANFFIWTYFCRLELREIIPFTKNYFFEICLFRSKCCFGLFSFIWPTFCCFVKPHKCLYNVLLLFLNLLTFCCLFSLVYCVSVYSITYLQFYRCYELYARFTFFSKRYIWIRFLFLFYLYVVYFFIHQIVSV